MMRDEGKATDARPLAIIVGATSAQLRHFASAIERAGYRVTVLAAASDLIKNGSARQADLLVYNSTVASTALLSWYRAVGQRPALLSLNGTRAVPQEGFDTSTVVPGDAGEVERFLRRRLDASAGNGVHLPEPAIKPAAQRSPVPSATNEPARATQAWGSKPLAVLAPDLGQPARPSSASTSATAIGDSALTPHSAPKASAARSAIAYAPIVPAVPTPAPRRSLRAWLLGIVLVAIALSVGIFVLQQRRSATSTPAPAVSAVDVKSVATQAVVTPAVTAQAAIVSMAAQAVATPAITAQAAIVSNTDVSANIIGVHPQHPAVGEVVNIEVKIRNTGQQAIKEPFWVDLYVSPQRRPTVNQGWETLSDYGATWLVDGLDAGETRTLDTLNADPARSNLLRFPIAGAQEVYVLVNSYQTGARASVVEDASNNLIGPLRIDVTP